VPTARFDVVTGAFGYTGRFIAAHLLARGRKVTTLVSHPGRPDAFAGQVRAAPLSFDRPDALVESLRGADTLYNTYWIRFARGAVTFEQAIANTQVLLAAAREAGVRRLVHFSVSNPAADSPLPYYRGKALTERVVVESGLSHAIIRPTLLFGQGDILINNIAWMLRRFPFFAVLGRGDYRVQPIAADEVAEIALAAAGADDDTTLDAGGPETLTFDALVRLIARAVRSRAYIIHAPPQAALLLGAAVGRLVRDVVVTRDEYEGLAANLLVVDGPPAGRVRIGDWLEQNADALGRRYQSELKRHFPQPGRRVSRRV